MISTPATALPADPASLGRYLRAAHLSSLQSLYSTKLSSHLHFAALDAAEKRARKGRQKRRRGSPPHHDDPHDEEEEEEWERRKSLHFGGPAPGEHIDKAHAYALGYDLAPEGAADIYYHGNHPRPPPKVVYSLLNTTRYAPFFDPEHLTTAQLRSAAVPLLENSAHPPPRPDQSPADATKEWESTLIALFSTGCDERIGRSNQRNGKNGRPAAITRNSFPGSQDGAGIPGGVEGYSMRMAAPPAQHSHSHAHSHQNPQHPHHHQAPSGPHPHQQPQPPPLQHQQQPNGRNGQEYFAREPQGQPSHPYPPPPPQQQPPQSRQYW